MTTNRLLGVIAVFSVFGMVGLALTGLIGFEEPNSTLLLVSSILIFAAPVAMLVHLSVTRELTRDEKRIWIQAMTSARAARVFSAYLTSPDRRTTAQSLATEALARRAGRP